MGTVNRELLWRLTAFKSIEIDLITSALDNRYSSESFSKKICIYRVPVGRGNIHHATRPELVLYAFQAFQIASRIHKKAPYDFSFAWSALPAGAVSYGLSVLFNLPFMTWISGPDTPGFEKRYDYIFPVLKPFLKVIWRRSQPLIAKCQEEIDLIHAVVPDIQVQIIPNGVDIHKFFPGDRIPEKGPLKVVCSARLIERKGQWQLIEAAKMLKENGIEFQIHFLGDGDARKRFKDLAIRLNVIDCIKFEGFIDPSDMPHFLRNAHIFSLPSYFEGMSLATLEAMATGMPLIVTKTAGTGGLIHEGVNGFAFEWQDISALAKYIEQLAEDRELARRMGAASLEFSKQFAWEEITSQFLSVFEELYAKKSNQV